MEFAISFFCYIYILICSNLQLKARSES